LSPHGSSYENWEECGVAEAPSTGLCAQ